MSELDIADALRVHMAKQKIKEHWYNVPFVVLIGPERFRIGTTTTDYSIKAPNPTVLLKEGSAIHVDFAPMDPVTKTWGDWSTTCVFRPKSPAEKEQLAFLEMMRTLQRKGISQITAETTGAEIARYFLNQFESLGVTLLDVRNNVGHSIHAGPKVEANRTWLDLNNTNPLGPGIFTVEPGGIRNKDHAFARFEECILIPKSGHATIIGSKVMVPIEI